MLFRNTQKICNFIGITCCTGVFITTLSYLNDFLDYSDNHASDNAHSNNEVLSACLNYCIFGCTLAGVGIVSYEVGKHQYTLWSQRKAQKAYEEQEWSKNQLAQIDKIFAELPVEKKRALVMENLAVHVNGKYFLKFSCLAYPYIRNFKRLVFDPVWLVVVNGNEEERELVESGKFISVKPPKHNKNGQKIVVNLTKEEMKEYYEYIEALREAFKDALEKLKPGQYKI